MIPIMRTETASTDATAPPSLSCHGVPLDASPGSFGFLRASADVAGDPGALRERMAEDGYLYLPGLLDREAVRETRMRALEILAGDGLMDDSYPLEGGVLRPGADVPYRPRVFQKLPELNQVLYSGAMMAFFRNFLGGEVLHFDYTWFRSKGRGPGTLPHCDIVYMGRGTRRLFTAWTPYGDLSLEQGGLMILENSHRQGQRLRRYLERDVDAYCTNRPPNKQTPDGKGFDGALSQNAATLREHLGGRWLSAEYRMGDVLIFTMGTVHAGLDNQTDRIRLSSDSRYQLASEPADERWIGENPIAHGPNAKKGLIC